MQENIAVSIVCNAYNHEKYIRDALESFIMQKTNFKFEVLVHDDASTDGTADIIREYEEKYPDIIRPIYQKENQYSKKINIGMKFQFPRVKGKYIAVCEGDDYWIDSHKLQKQFDAMEKHPEIDICAHCAEKRDSITNKLIGYIEPTRENTILSTEQVIEGGGGYVATNSLFYRSILNDNMPQFRREFGFDFSLQMHGALRGGMLYLSDCMSVYRVGVENSWTTRTGSDKTKLERHYEMMKKAYAMADRETYGKYTKSMNKPLLEFAINYCDILIPLSVLKEPPYVEVYKKFSLKKRTKIKIKYYSPWIVVIKRKISKFMKY